MIFAFPTLNYKFLIERIEWIDNYYVCRSSFVLVLLPNRFTKRTVGIRRIQSKNHTKKAVHRNREMATQTPFTAIAGDLIAIAHQRMHQVTIQTQWLWYLCSMQWNIFEILTECGPFNHNDIIESTSHGEERTLNDSFDSSGTR